MARWAVEIIYRTDAGENCVPHEVEELSEIETLVERGPDWNTIIAIRVVLARMLSPGLTVEQAEHI